MYGVTPPLTEADYKFLFKLMDAYPNYLTLQDRVWELVLKSFPGNPDQKAAYARENFRLQKKREGELERELEDLQLLRAKMIEYKRQAQTDGAVQAANNQLKK